MNSTYLSSRYRRSPVVTIVCHVHFQEDYDRLRVISYMNCDVFLVCFSVSDRESLDSVGDHWVPELKHYLPATPFILVGTGIDRRDGTQESGVRITFVYMYSQISISRSCGYYFFFKFKLPEVQINLHFG